MLSIHEDMRNWIGQRFVELRILYEDKFRWLFPNRTSPTSTENQTQTAVRKEWTWRLTKAAKDDLFNMFHNKSDDFLELVAQERIKIIGMPTDDSATEFFEFQSTETLRVSPDWIVPSIGFRSTIESILEGEICLADFFLGCRCVKAPGLYLVGFARPIIGNIPSISEMQAAYVTELIAGKTHTQDELQIIEKEHARNRINLQHRFSKLNLDAIYPVEMFPYCDELAKRMNLFPTMRSIGSISDWIRLQWAPATTIQYFWSNPQARKRVRGIQIYMPMVLIVLLLTLKPVDAMYRAYRWLKGAR